MDKKIQDALKSDKHPEVRFTINNTRDVTVKDNKFAGTINGTLYIAGVSRTENIPFTGQLISGNRIQIKGSKKVKMTDFKISPPTAMLGALKTGDEVTVSFTLVMAMK
jgi:polyisoprenoid-binding protein YceI